MATRGKAYNSRSFQGRLPRLGNLELVKQIEVTYQTLLRTGLSEDGATWGISTGRPLEGETTMVEWSGLARIACRTTTFSQPEMCWALRVTCFLENQASIHHSRAQSGPHLLPCLYRQPQSEEHGWVGVVVDLAGHLPLGLGIFLATF